MLPSQTGIIGEAEISEALGEINLPLGYPILMNYPNHQLIGYYTGRSETVSKLGFVKNLNPCKIQGLVSYDTDFPKSNDLQILSDDLAIMKPLTGSLEESINITQHTPVEVVLWPNIGYLGFWSGIESNGDIKLDLILDKKTNEYGKIHDVAKMLGHNSNPNLEFENPNIKRLATIYVLKV